MTLATIYLIAASCETTLFASIIDAFNEINIFSIFSLVISSIINSQISLSLIILNALKIINNGIGILTRGICK